MAKNWKEIVDKKAVDEFMKFGVLQHEGMTIFFSLVNQFKAAKPANADMAHQLFNIFLANATKVGKTGGVGEEGFDVNFQGIEKAKVEKAWNSANGKLIKNFGNKAVLSKLGPKAPAPQDLFDEFVAVLDGFDVLKEFDPAKKADKQTRQVSGSMRANFLSSWEPYRVKLEKVGFKIAKIT